MNLNAYNDIMELLNEDETIEGVVFGPWTYRSPPAINERWRLSTGETRAFVPFERRGKLLTIEEAKPYMEGWTFQRMETPESIPFGAYTTAIWTNQRVFSLFISDEFFVHFLTWVPRDPCDYMPGYPGDSPPW